MTNELRILLIEDSITDALLIDREVSSAGLASHCSRVDTKEDFLRELADHPPDVILSDHGLPDFDTFAALDSAKTLCPDTPFIFVTGAQGEAVAIKAFESGAADYILKERLKNLSPAIRRTLREREERIGRQRAEQALRKSEGRTAELDAATKELEHFSYSIAHDLRTPLRNVESCVEMLERNAAPGLDDKSCTQLKMIADSARQMRKLIDELFAFARVGQTEMYRLRFSSADTVKEVLHDLRPETEGRHIEWRIGELPVVEGDPVMLWLVWVNLISNALKFTRPRQAARIEIGCDTAERDFVFFIRDNGVGFDGDKADKLFTIFQRLHAAGEFEGLGVGLANVRRIVQRHGGRTSAAGRANEGATFYFTLPRCTD